ncbi:MAG TPA: N-succinylarginine dihydrolase [Usitatibacteraceae bacterium]
MNAAEFNFDGLVGPTHNYSGLSFGNIASSINQGAVANPKLAALQGLAKMKALHDRGFKQGVLAPQERPSIATLRALGFTGSDAEVVQTVAQQAPLLLGATNSASSMWAANAATVSPSANTTDGRVHFTAANLNNKIHRSIEHPTTSRLLKAMFPGGKHFAHHAALPGCPQMGDEGAANHTRICSSYGEPGVELFVYGATGFNTAAPAPQKYPARQMLEASQAVARLHGVPAARSGFAQQNPAVIDAGVFHNDVIAVGNGNVLFCHQQAFLNQAVTYAELREKFGTDFMVIEVGDEDVTVAEAVSTYLFNSQLLTRADGKMLLVLPEECRSNTRVWAYLQKLLVMNTPIQELLIFDLRESMRNGGGPACLRLRVELNEAEARAVNPGVLMSDALYSKLTAWVEKYYRDRLADADLADPQLLLECRRALDELTLILRLGVVYPFQLN